MVSTDFTNANVIMDAELTVESLIGRLLSSGSFLFGDFKLKSGTASPYFFDIGKLIATGADLNQLAIHYSILLEKSNVKYDSLFGPAYKGIPLAAAVACHLKQNMNKEVCFAFDRKEKKDHGEGGNIVGKIGNNVVIIDDVFTFGTAVTNTINCLSKHSNANIKMVAVFLDRQESMHSHAHSQAQLNETSTASENFTKRTRIPVLSILKLDDILCYMKKNSAYRVEYNRLKKHLDSVRC